VEVEGAALPSGTDDGGSAGLWAARSHGVVQLPTSSIAPFVLVGGGALGANGDSIGNDMDPAVHFGLGAKAALDEFLSLRLDLRDTMSQKSDAENGRQTHHPELLLGLTFTLDRTRPEPSLPPDADGDGLADAQDQCPNQAGFRPDGCPVRDSDGDGVADASDSCPAAAGPTPTGCPPPTDADRDEVPDDRDRCPQQPGQPPDGCPDPDPDGDGSVGDADRCPNQPETINGYQDEDGCPDQLPEPAEP
jgi:hypothetical protein